MKRVVILASIGAVLALSACVSEPAHRYGQACNPDGTNCTPVVCNRADECGAVPYAYRDTDGRYIVTDRTYYGPAYTRPMKVCDRYGNDCYWVPRSADGRYYDRTGATIEVEP